MNDLKGYEIHATDGSIGKAHDFFFDDQHWIVRYVIVDTGWLFGRRVLIAPDAFSGLDPDSATLSVALTKKEVEDGPGIGTDLPVSRQEEIALREHFGWPEYWEIHPGGTGAAPSVTPAPPPAADVPSLRDSAEAEARAQGDPHLRSVREVMGYHVKASDDKIGHVEDFVVDDNLWLIRYLVLDTRNWLPGRRVLVEPAWAKSIDWAGRLVSVELDRKAIESAPPYDPKASITRDYEDALRKHFTRAA